jgi:hypothetical protein
VALTVEIVAAILVASEHHEAAARLYGAVDALRKAISLPIGVLDQPAHERHRATVRVALEEAAFTRARKEGWQLPLPIAVTDAVEVMATIGDD